MSIYEQYTPKQTEKHLESFLVDTLSYSMITAFSRNEKAFEMKYIYRQREKSSATSIAGSAYHWALERYFTAIQNGEEKLFDIVDMQQFAYDYIEERPAFIWKIQKTTPTVEDCKLKAIKLANSLLENFFKELTTYTEGVKHVLDTEVSFDQYLTINGVDIPIKCRGKIDNVFEIENGKTVIIDHKSKSIFSNEEEIKLSIGVQAIMYVLGYEKHSGGIRVDEVWFIENKHSKNKDGGKQLHKFVVVIDDNTRRLYEFLLYENIKRVLGAITDPDYIYLINSSDKLVDLAELYEFWAKTMIAEVDDFNVPDNKKELIKKRLKKIRDAEMASISPQIIKKFQENAAAFITYDLSNKNMNPSQKIEHVLTTFNKPVNVKHIFSGYSSDTYLLDVQMGIKITSIQAHKLDIANALDVENVRIAKDLVVHDGKSYLSIECVTSNSDILMWDKSKLVDKKIPLGEDNFGNVVVWDLDNQSTPHCLVGGGTGSGKSTELISILEYIKLAGITDVVILDPKMEFTKYANEFKVVNDILEIEEEMKSLVEEMNEKIKTGKKSMRIVIFDEFADAVLNSRKGSQLDIKEMVEEGFYKQSALEIMAQLPPSPKLKLKTVGQLKSLNDNLQILLQKGRSSGLRLICAAQRADTSIINGNSKANLPVQICFRVDKQVSSIVMIDEPGAEGLRGRGDGLLRSPQYPGTVRFQGYYYNG